MDKDRLIRRLQEEVKRMALEAYNFSPCDRCGGWSRRKILVGGMMTCPTCISSMDRLEDERTGLSAERLNSLADRMAIVKAGVLLPRREAPHGVKVCLFYGCERQRVAKNNGHDKDRIKHLNPSSWCLLARMKREPFVPFQDWKEWIPAEWLVDGSMRLIGPDGAMAPDWSPGAANGPGEETGEEATS